VNTGQLLSNFIGTGIGYSLAALFMAFRRRSWTRRAHKLAASSDIALPDPLAPRVARFLRDEFLFGLLVTWVSVAPLVGILTPDGRQHLAAQSFPWILAGLPLACVCMSYALTVWPRWRASGASRVTHLGRMTIRQAFTPAEATVAVLGAALAAVTGGWGLWLAAAPAWWWIVCTAAFGAGAFAWWHATSAIMNRPSSASDEIELGWDDLLRFRRVRGLTIGAALLPAIVVFLADYQLAFKFDGSQPVPLWPFLPMIAAAVIAFSVFRQGSQLWRQAWTPPVESTDSSASRPW